VANDGVHALSQARQMKPSLILLDILLPDLDGLSVCEILRRQPSTKNIPVIFMSALTSEVTKRTVAIARPRISSPSRWICRVWKNVSGNCCLTSRLRNKSGFRPNRHRNLNLFRHRL